jgi:predicted dehydrogenase
MPVDETLTVAVVGCGLIAATHLAALQTITGVRLAAVCDSNEQLAREMAVKFGIDHFFTDISELLSKTHPDVCHISTPPQTHLPLVLQVLRSGSHVLVEKPAALRLDEFEQMVMAAKQNGVVLSAVHNVIFVPVVLRAKALVERGEIGEIVAMHITQTEHNRSPLIANPNHWCHKLPGGIFGEMLPHPLYLANSFISDLQVVSVHCGQYTMRSHLANDEVHITLSGKTGLATITATVRGIGNTMSVGFVGTKGQLRVAVSNGVLTVHKTAPGESRIPMGRENLRTACRWLADTASVALLVLLRRYPGGHHQIIHRFYEALRGRGESAVTLDEIREATRLYETVTSLIPTEKN